MISSRKLVIFVIFCTAIFIYVISRWMESAFTFSPIMNNSYLSLHSRPVLKILVASTNTNLHQYISTISQFANKSKLTTSLPLTGLANNTLIGRFHESLSFPINWPHLCSPDHGKNLTLLIVVISSILADKARYAIRGTWGGYARTRGAKLIFLVGKSSKVEIQEHLIQENSIFMDIVQENLEDAYYNLTLKTVGMMKWVSEFCEHVKFLLKSDDDVFINIDLLLHYIKLRRVRLRKTIVGSLWPDGEPIREKGWWHVPKSLYPYPYYPIYVSGGAYLVTGDSVPILYKTSLQVPYFTFEDVLMTGMVAKKAGVKRIDNPKFIFDELDIEKCKFMNMITSHSYNPENMTAIWTEFIRKDIDCKNKSSPIT